MKKFVSLLWLAIAVMILTACNSNENTDDYQSVKFNELDFLIPNNWKLNYELDDELVYNAPDEEKFLIFYIQSYPKHPYISKFLNFDDMTYKNLKLKEKKELNNNITLMTFEMDVEIENRNEIQIALIETDDSIIEFSLDMPSSYAENNKKRINSIYKSIKMDNGKNRDVSAEPFSMADMCLKGNEDSKLKICYGMTRKEVEKRIGAGEGDSWVRKYFPGLTLYYRDDKVSGIILKSSEALQTARGITIGSTSKEVKEKFGSRQGVQTHDGGLYYNFFKESNPIEKGYYKSKDAKPEDVMQEIYEIWISIDRQGNVDEILMIDQLLGESL